MKTMCFRLGGASIADVLRGAGAQIRESWCGPCFGQGPDALAPGQRAITTFNRDWSRRVCRGGPIVIIISDGWDRGEPEILSSAMDRLSRSVKRVIWVNPLAGRDGYRPETRGMQAAMPYVDDFLPGGNFNDLRTLVGLLESVPAR